MSPTSRSTDESSPVEDHESLLRHFPSDPGKYDFNLAVPRLSCFLPTGEDKDGLCFNREVFVAADQLLALARNANVRQYGGVLAVLAVWLRDQGLTVRPDPADTPGHVLVPEMNRNDYDASRGGKEKIKTWADKLVRLVAQHGQIRIHPTPKPPAN
jgi:hypothetical protein